MIALVVYAGILLVLAALFAWGAWSDLRAEQRELTSGDDLDAELRELVRTYRSPYDWASELLDPMELLGLGRDPDEEPEELA